MKKTVLVFGVLSGLVSTALMFATLPFLEKIGFDKGLIVGYTGIVLSLLFVYFGVRSYRDNKLGGKIAFGRAFGVGLLITLISCVFYVVSWQILSRNFMPDFADQYGARVIADARKAGADEASIAKTTKEMDDMKKMMNDPIVGSAMVFIEPFPVGLLVTLISAGVLRKR
jgi:Zn-dependent protease with chaperone function